ncbi:hypothetical protein [Pseudocnuella soli]|uniref:hypothetical protein n=1 Tax=Pseudocnuella soli TaxID=2502779 RepID=UPI0010441E85|nr:hypothetical protein [Pseudocnuella soli]
MKAFQQKNILKWLAVASVAAAFVVHFSTDYAIGGASPLALLLTATGALALMKKAELVASLLLLFAGGSLLIFPFLNVAPPVYTFLSLPMLVLGLIQSISWWQQENN